MKTFILGYIFIALYTVY